MMAARFGDETAMHYLMVCYRNKYGTKDDLATTRRAHKAAIDTGKNEAREYAMRQSDFITKELIKLGYGHRVHPPSYHVSILVQNEYP